MKKLTIIIALLAGMFAAQAAAQTSQTAGNLLPVPNAPDSFVGYLANEPGLAFNKTYLIDMSQYKGSRISAQVLYSSGTFATVTFSTANYTLNSTKINATGHGLTLALPLLYTVVSGPTVQPLTNQTTYYAIPVTANSIGLATSSANAQAGTFITFTSTTTSTNSYTLAPLAIAGTPSFKWESSNDGTNFATALSTGTISITSYSNPPADYIADFGSYNFRYLRLNVTAPTAGGLFIQAIPRIKQDGIGPF